MFKIKKTILNMHLSKKKITTLLRRTMKKLQHLWKCHQKSSNYQLDKKQKNSGNLVKSRLPQLLNE